MPIVGHPRPLAQQGLFLEVILSLVLGTCPQTPYKLMLSLTSLKALSY